MTVPRFSGSTRFWIAILAAGLLVSMASLAADNPPVKGKTPAGTPAMDEQTQQMMAMMEKMGAPGPEHAQLMKLAGNWKATTKSWMGPGDPIINEGISVRKAVLGGRFLMEQVKSTFNNKPFEGMGLTGYDNQQKKYISFWVDSMGTMMMTSEGTMDASGKVLTMTSDMLDPASGQKSPVKMVSTFVDSNNEKFEMFASQGGQEMKMMEITYTRTQ
jgi:uncharacterized protein DUF1579